MGSFGHYTCRHCGVSNLYDLDAHECGTLDLKARIAELEAELAYERKLRIRREDAADHKIAELEAELAEAREHERQTHEQLSAILGDDDALHVVAQRAVDALATMEHQYKFMHETFGEQNKEITDLTAENAALREWASPILRWVKDVRCTRDTVADLWFWLEAHVRTCPAAIDAGKGE